MFPIPFAISFFSNSMKILKRLPQFNYTYEFPRRVALTVPACVIREFVFIWGRGIVCLFVCLFICCWVFFNDLCLSPARWKVRKRTPNSIAFRCMYFFFSLTSKYGHIVSIVFVFFFSHFSFCFFYFLWGFCLALLPIMAAIFKVDKKILTIHQEQKILKNSSSETKFLWLV